MTQATPTIQTNFSGSIANYESVKRQIAERWSPKEAEKYDPSKNCATYKRWTEEGYYILPGSSALHSVVIIEKKDRSGKVIARYPKRVALFCWLQVSPISK